MLRQLRKAPLVLAFAILGACGGDDKEDKEPLGGGVGAACSANSQCTGYTNPACVREIKPLADLVDPNNAELEPFRNLTLPFPGGYCSSTLQNACTAKEDCGADADCFLAFEGVPQETIDALAGLGLPFDIHRFAEIGICMKSCTANSECRTGKKYECLTPLKAFMDVINPTYEKTFCVQDVDVSHLLVGGGDGG
ncbi:MAG TPA: hypothetical protein VK524_08270 [Polyangiaceae bacterium]|nr:hypothetical protein [Polyangiaceae bacterium]